MASARLSPVSPVIDTHQHFWRYTPEEYGWIGDDRLRRDFLPADLAPLLRESGVDACIAVQARETVAETEWLLALARENPFIRGVVGWVPLGDGPDAAAPILERLAATVPALRGVREIAQGKPTGFLLRPAFNEAVARLAPLDLVYDILIYADQLPEATAFVDRHPAQTFVLDHAAKPRIRSGEREPWATHLRDLARRPNVTCKVSGLTTEADAAAWTPADLHPYFDTLLEAFGAGRLLFGSDWPVCTVACEYDRWVETVREFCAALSEGEREGILGGNAGRVYGP